MILKRSRSRSPTIEQPRGCCFFFFPKIAPRSHFAIPLPRKYFEATGSTVPLCPPVSASLSDRLCVPYIRTLGNIQRRQIHPPFTTRGFAGGTGGKRAAWGEHAPKAASLLREPRCTTPWGSMGPQLGTVQMPGYSPLELLNCIPRMGYSKKRHASHPAAGADVFVGSWRSWIA